MRFATLLALLGLGGCQTDQPASYVRSDNKFELTLAQCQGEGKAATADYGLLGSGSTGGVVGWATGLADRSEKESGATKACMARNGYISR